MMTARPLGSRADLVQIIEFHGPTHDAQWMLPDAAPDMLAANASWLADQYWMPRTNRAWLAPVGTASPPLAETKCRVQRRNEPNGRTTAPWPVRRPRRAQDCRRP